MQVEPVPSPHRRSWLERILGPVPPARPAWTLRDPWPGETGRGETLLQDRARLLEWLGDAGADANPEWLAWLHGFAWLRDARAIGGDAARRFCREAVVAWIDRNGRTDPLPDRPDVLGRRVAAWLANYEFFAASADDAFRERMMASLSRQARQLARSAGRATPGAGRIAALTALVHAGASIGRGERWLAQGVEALLREISVQVLPDGGHIERCPSTHLDVLMRLIETRAILSQAQGSVPDLIGRAVETMASILRFYRHGDGGLALFNGGTEEDTWAIDLALTQSGAKSRFASSAPDLGFERLAAGKALVLADLGAPPPAGFDRLAHAGTLSFEMSVGRERLIVNCGAHVGRPPHWRAFSRVTAAHSTVTVGDRNSSEVLAEGGLGRRPAAVRRGRRDDAGSIWIDASHDGYLDGLGLTHRRRLYLAAGGADLRGEDTLIGAAGQPFAVRFHLHPAVRASLVQDGAAVLLLLPSGAGWRLRCSGGRLGLSESIYLGTPGVVKRSEQIVIEGETGSDGGRVKWALQAVPRS